MWLTSMGPKTQPSTPSVLRDPYSSPKFCVDVTRSRWSEDRLSHMVRYAWEIPRSPLHDSVKSQKKKYTFSSLRKSLLTCSSSRDTWHCNYSLRYREVFCLPPKHGFKSFDHAENRTTIRVLCVPRFIRQTNKKIVFSQNSTKEKMEGKD